MIEKTVFILGAGASCPYGFPSGSELREQIISVYVSDFEAYLNARARVKVLIPQELSKAKEFTDKFRKSTKSIDLFLALNPEFKETGKRAIIFRILRAEKQSHFREQSKHKDQDWYTLLFECMTKGFVKKDDYSRFCENDVSFITFNYDRSLEHFLYDSLLNSFVGIGGDKIAEQLNRIKVIHVFGKVAPLEWQDRNGVEYRQEINSVNADELIKNLRTIYEGMENPELKEAKDLIGKAKSIYFLGFGYAKENLDVLGIPEILSTGQLVYGTALGLTERKIQEVRSVLQYNSGSKGGVANPRIDKSDSLALLSVCL